MAPSTNTMRSCHCTYCQRSECEVSRETQRLRAPPVQQASSFAASYLLPQALLHLLPWILKALGIQVPQGLLVLAASFGIAACFEQRIPSCFDAFSCRNFCFRLAAALGPPQVLRVLRPVAFLRGALHGYIQQQLNPIHRMLTPRPWLRSNPAGSSPQSVILHSREGCNHKLELKHANHERDALFHTSRRPVMCTLPIKRYATDHCTMHFHHHRNAVEKAAHHMIG
jgi:hypothetical protein